MSTRSSKERKRIREKRTITATIGYSFVIVLIVLLVMSQTLTNFYTKALMIERGEAMKSLAIASSTALSHTNINENMTYPLDVYGYDDENNYIFDIYTKAGNSFLRLYTSSSDADIDDYTLEGAGDEYNECFEEQIVTLTTRTEDKVDYVCAIAPIISPQNTVAGILEIRMPVTDFGATSNGMSLSWIFTILAIAVSIGVLIYEFNMLISTISRGMRPNVPILISYGIEGCSFLSFFYAFAAIMQPIVFSQFFKDSLYSYPKVLSQILIGITLIFYAFGFFSFAGLRRSLKNSFTSNFYLIGITVVGYVLSLLCGAINNPYVLMVLALPIGIANGSCLDFLRDYRINSKSLGIPEFGDRIIHITQLIGYVLGVSVGSVIGGIFYERFGLAVVMIVSGALLVLTSIALVFFMPGNTTVRESYLPINTWLETLTNKKSGNLQLSTFFVLGVIASYCFVFLPNFLETVGISLATSSFYYLLIAFVAFVIMPYVKKNIANVLTLRLRVLISSVSTIAGLLLFAIIPTAKIMVITVALFGVAIGIHDYTYMYALSAACRNIFRCNIRKCCENTFLLGFIFAIPVFVIALTTNVSIVFIILSLVVVILALLYPLSSNARQIDEQLSNSSKKSAQASYDTYNNNSNGGV